MGDDLQAFNTHFSKTSSYIDHFWNAEIDFIEEEKKTEPLNILDISPESNKSIHDDMKYLLSNVTNLQTRLQDLKGEVKEKLFNNKESYNTMVLTLIQSWQLKVEELTTTASKKIKQLEHSRMQAETELQQTKQSLEQKCTYEDELNEVIVGLLDNKQALTDELTEAAISKEELVQEIDHSKNKLIKAENRISNLESKGTEKDTMLIELTAELETVSDLMTQEKQKNECAINELKESLRKANMKLFKESAASDSLAKEVFTLQQMVDESKNELLMITKNYNMQSRLTEELQEQRKKLEEDLEDKSKCIVEYEEKSGEISQELSVLKSEKYLLYEQVTMVESSKDDINEKQLHMMKENKSLKDELADLKKLCDELKHNNTNLENSKKDLNNQLNSAISYKEELEQKNIIVQVENRNL